MKNLKIHFQNRSSEVIHPLCMTKPSLLKSSRDIKEVTCKRCLHLVNQKTTEQGGPKNQGCIVDVVITDVGPQVIEFIKALRNISVFFNSQNRQSLPKAIQNGGFGLKEAKEFADSVRYGNREQTLLSLIDEETAFKVQRILLAAGAKVDVRDEEGRNINTPNQGTESGRLTAIEKAYHEMLGLFFRDVINNKLCYEDYLDQFDDDEKTGHRFFPPWTNPRIADLRRWVAAGKK